LGPIPCIAIASRFLGNPLLSYESQTPHAKLTRQRRNNLATDAEPAIRKLVYVHANIDEGNAEPPAMRLELIALEKTVNATEYDCAIP
jgi:hypothetical protein